MRKVLIPFDGSEASMHSLEYIESLAGAFQQCFPSVELYVLNVQRDVHVFGEYVTPAMLEDMRADLVRHGEHINQKAVSFLKDLGLSCESLSRIGEVAEVICDVAEELACDHIIMGTRGLGKFGNLLLGSVANQVIHEATLPVTLIKPLTLIK